MNQDESEVLPLFVYGSLLDAVHRAEIIGREVAAIPATLYGFERGRARYWYLRPRAGAVTPGLILEHLTAADFVVLDRYEELPTLYTREAVEVAGQSGTVRCWAYLPTSWAPAGDE
jgi:Gamma-glutamyl cyclotransferase, AIG2-like